MENKKLDIGDPDSVPYFLDKIFDNLERLFDKTEKVEEEIRQIRGDIAKTNEHGDIVKTLGQNLSAEGLKELIADVTDLKKYKEREVSAQQTRTDILKYALMIGIPMFMAFVSFWVWLLQKYFFK